MRERGLVMSHPKDNERYTYADYCSWDDGKRWELHEGVAYAMTGPLTEHQRISMRLSSILDGFLRGKPCVPFAAPYDVRLNPHDGDDTVVQPDLLVVCDRSKITEKCCVGAPDFIIEILSPTTARHDRLLKFNLYLKTGVREYWIIDPESKTVQVCELKDGQYTTNVYDEVSRIPVSTLPGLDVNMADVFIEM